MKGLIVILFASCAVACAPKKRETLLSISLERTGCYGTCPAYLVTLTKDGTVTFEGRQYVATKGISTKHIPPEDLTPIVHKIDEIKFWSLKSSYDSGITDVPTKFVTVLTDLREKKVKDRDCEPEGLQELEKMIDQVAGVSEWIGDTKTNKP